MEAIRSLIIGSVIVLSLAHQNTWARGDEANNGAGMAKKNILFAFNHLEKFIDLCLISTNCKVSEDELTILEKIKAILPAERAQEKPIVFKSETKHPNTFIINGEVKVAKTSLHSPSTIYFNTDQLYRVNTLGVVEAISIGEAAALVLHELGHHLGIVDHDRLDVLGSKIEYQLQNHILKIPFDIFTQSEWVVFINYYPIQMTPTFLLTLKHSSIDLSKRFQKLAKCPLPEEGPEGEFLGRHVLISNLHWEDPSVQTQEKVLKGQMAQQCTSSEGEEKWYSGRFILKFDTITKTLPGNANDEFVHVEGDSIQLSMDPNFKWKELQRSVPLIY